MLTPMNKPLQKQPAYSLVFAFMMMTVIMLIAGTTIQNTQDKIIYFSDLEASSQARLAAESAAEQALIAIASTEAGYSPSGEESFCLEYNGSSTDCKSSGDYIVYGQALENTNDSSGYYYLPIPGTGTAAPQDNCSVLASHEAVNHPCNWNKISYGQSVTIPLMVSDGTSSYNPDDLGLDHWILRVRTPCENGEYEADCDDDGSEGDDRYVFDGSSNTVSSTNSSVILWQLNGETVDGDSVSLIPDKEDITCGYASCFNTVFASSSPTNTDIFEGLINDPDSLIGYGDYAVLAADNSTAPYDTLYDTSTYTDGGTTSLASLELQISVISVLEDSSGSSIPYLEWQLIVDNLSPYTDTESIADTKSVVIGEGYHEGQSGVFYYPYVITRSTTDESTSIYTLAN
jgi:hypothetical protein